MDMLINTREHGDDKRFSTRMIFCVFCIQLFTEAVPMTNVTNASNIYQYTTDKDNLTLYNVSNGYQENAKSFTEYFRTNSVQRTNIGNNISETVTTDSVLTNKSAKTMTTSTIENISTFKDTNLHPSKSHAKFDPMAALVTDLMKTKRNFNQNQCKGVYEPVLISAGLMKPHLPSDINVSQKSTHEPSPPNGIKSGGNSNTTNSSINSRKESEKGNINQYDNAQMSESENKIDYYGDAYYDEAYYGYYGDYYYDDEPEESKCCKSYGVSEDCLGLCLGDRVFDCSMLCKYMFGHIARTCIENHDKLLKNEHMPLYG